jgi:hypothetical protein
MRYVIRLRDIRYPQYYQNVNRQPMWVDKLADATVFTDLRKARAVLAVLRGNWITRAEIVKLPTRGK